MFTYKCDEIEGYKLIIARQFEQINLLERDNKHLKTLNAVKFDSFKKKAEEAYDNKIKYAKNLYDEINEKEKKIYIDKKESHKLSDFINDFMKKNDIQCPICYEVLNIENIYVPKCHSTHIICSKCRCLVDKCPLCKNNFDEDYNLEFEFEKNKYLILELHKRNKLFVMSEEATISDHKSNRYPQYPEAYIKQCSTAQTTKMIQRAESDLKWNGNKTEVLDLLSFCKKLKTFYEIENIDEFLSKMN